MKIMKRFIKLVAITLIAFSLEAMEAPAMKPRMPLDVRIAKDDVKLVSRFIKTFAFDPNKSLGQQSPEWYQAHPEWQSLWKNKKTIDQNILFLASQNGKTHIVEYLSPLVNDDVIRFVLTEAIRKHPGADFAKWGITSEQKDALLKIETLLMNEAYKRGIDVQEILNNALFFAAYYGGYFVVRDLLDMDADRTSRDYQGKNLIDVIKSSPKSNEEKERMITLIRTYAKDLKTRTALHLLNLIREGKITKEQLEAKPLPGDIIELIDKLANSDEEAKVKLEAIGLPYYPPQK